LTSRFLAARNRFVGLSDGAARAAGLSKGQRSDYAWLKQSEQHRNSDHLPASSARAAQFSHQDQSSHSQSPAAHGGALKLHRQYYEIVLT